MNPVDVLQAMIDSDTREHRLLEWTADRTVEARLVRDLCAWGDPRGNTLDDLIAALIAGPPA